jgi:hypothetical protein
MTVDLKAVKSFERRLDRMTLERVVTAVDRIVAAKERGGKVVVVTGSGPNVHEGVTTLVAELMRVGVVDGVTTSSAVVAHEMAGVLDRVKRVDGEALGLPATILPRGGSCAPSGSRRRSSRCHEALVLRSRRSRGSGPTSAR